MLAEAPEMIATHSRWRIACTSWRSMGVSDARRGRSQLEQTRVLARFKDREYQNHSSSLLQSFFVVGRLAVVAALSMPLLACSLWFQFAVNHWNARPERLATRSPQRMLPALKSLRPQARG